MDFIRMVSEFGSHCCCNKLPQSCWLKKTKTIKYYLTVLKVGNRKRVSLVWNKGDRRTSLFQGVLGRICLLAFSNFWVCLQSLASGFLPSSKLVISRPLVASFSCNFTVTLTLLPASSTFKVALPWHWPRYSSVILLYIQLIGNLNSICNLNSPLPCNITYLQVLENRTWTSLGDLYSAYHSERAI